MSLHQATSQTFPAPLGFGVALQSLMNEAGSLLQAMLSPGPIIQEVEQMYRLRRQADRLQASNPAAADALRRRATRIGLPN
jgi:hypothetical protein